jgi:hypothetical protein
MEKGTAGRPSPKAKHKSAAVSSDRELLQAGCYEARSVVEVTDESHEEDGKEDNGRDGRG